MSLNQADHSDMERLNCWQAFQRCSRLQVFMRRGLSDVETRQLSFIEWDLPTCDSGFDIIPTLSVGMVLRLFSCG